MGSHRARHRSDQRQSEELATDLLARLAAEAGPVRARPTARFPLDPFATGPIPARPARPSAQNLVLAGSAATRCAGPTGCATRDDAPTAVAEGPAGPSAPLQAAHDAADTDAPAGLAPGEPAGPTARVGRPPRTGLRVPLYATVSATVLTATAAVAASAGPSATTSANATPNRAAPSAAAAGTAALTLGLPTAAPTPVTPGTLGGPAALLAPDAALQGSDIAARAKSDAEALGTQQAADSLKKAMDGTIPAHTATPIGPVLPAAAMNNTAPKPAAAPAREATAKISATKTSATKTSAAPAGSALGSRALAMAKGKLGAAYVWGSAGPNAFDCSGLIVWAFKQLGKSLPHSSSSLSTMGAPVSKGALQPGDLVFFYSPVSHVGIYAGNGMVLNAVESGRPVQYSKLANMPFHNARRLTI